MFSGLFSTKRMSILSGAVLTVLLFVCFAAIFAVVLTFIDIDRKYIPFISSMCLCFAAFISSFSAAKKHGEKGFLIGGAIGLISFVIITVVSLIVSKSGFSFNTVFHFVFSLISSVLGGILGVGQGNKKII